MQMTLDEVLDRLERSGSKLDSLERAVGAIKARLRFWQSAALIAGGLAVVLFFAWRGARQRLERCEREKAQ
jgi:hypothetical protein